MVLVEFFLERGFLVKDVTIEKTTESIDVKWCASIPNLVQDFINSLEEDIPPVDNFYRAKIRFNGFAKSKCFIKEIKCCTAYSD